MIPWSELQEQAAIAFSALPAGEYGVVVTEATAVESKNGKPMIKVKLRVQDGAHAGRVVFNNFVVSTDNPTALGFFFRNMKAFGLDATYFAGNPTMPEIADRLLGIPVIVTLGVRTYQGEEQNEVKTIRPSTGGPVGMPAAVALPGMGASAPAAVPSGLPQATTLPAAPATAQAAPVAMEMPAPGALAQSVMGANAAAAAVATPATAPIEEPF